MNKAFSYASGRALFTGLGLILFSLFLLMPLPLSSQKESSDDIPLWQRDMIHSFLEAQYEEVLRLGRENREGFPGAPLEWDNLWGRLIRFSRGVVENTGSLRRTSRLREELLAEIFNRPPLYKILMKKNLSPPLSGEEGESSSKESLWLISGGLLLLVIFLILIVAAPFRGKEMSLWMDLLKRSRKGRAVSWSQVEGVIRQLNRELQNHIWDILEVRCAGGIPDTREISGILKELMPLIREQGRSSLKKGKRKVSAREMASQGNSWYHCTARRIGERTQRPGNSEAVARLFARMVESAEEKGGLPDPDTAYKAGLIHDIGFLTYPVSFFDKEELSASDRDLLREHIERGDRAAMAAQVPEEVRRIIRAHHERMDGSGYPHGLKGDDIPRGARFLGMADFYTALVSERIHRSALGKEKSLSLIAGLVGPLLDEKAWVALRRCVLGTT